MWPTSSSLLKGHQNDSNSAPYFARYRIWGDHFYGKSLNSILRSQHFVGVCKKTEFPMTLLFFFNLYGTFNKARKILQSEGWSPFRPVLGPLSWCFNWLEHLIARYCSITKLCLTLCNPMNCSKPGFPAHHHLPEFAHLMPIKLVISLLTSQSSNQIFSMGMESSQAPLRRSSSG